jgi:hypothetical protein
MKKEIHIISFDNIYPPKYGGTIDAFFKIKALYDLGFKIHLHCFVDQLPNDISVLTQISESLNFYKKKNSFFSHLSLLPFSVYSRRDSKIIENISAIEAPILIDNIKSSWILTSKKLKHYPKYLRLHNLEYEYFSGISKSESSIFKKLIFSIEAYKYKLYDKNLVKVKAVFTLSNYEQEVINNQYKNAIYIPVFHGNKLVKNVSQFGEYVLYHGDLNTSDNKKVVLFLIKIFEKLPHINLVIASGTNKKFVKNHIKTNNIKFVKFDTFEELSEILGKAHINICWSFQQSGTKIKVINSLFNSRFCIINQNIIDDTTVSKLCVEVLNEIELIDKIEVLMLQPYNNENLARKTILETYLNDKKNAYLLAKHMNLE